MLLPPAAAAEVPGYRHLLFEGGGTHESRMWYCQVAALEECIGVGVTIEYNDGRIVKDVDGSVRRVACHVERMMTGVVVRRRRLTLRCFHDVFY